jgi:hypothetical protein
VRSRHEYSEIKVPGTYVMEETGLLIRVPPDAVVKGRSPLVSVLGDGPIWVRLISDDPWLPLHKARGAAANQDLLVNF